MSGPTPEERVFIDALYDAGWTAPGDAQWDKIRIVHRDFVASRAQPKPAAVVVKLPQCYEFYDTGGSYYTDHSMRKCKLETKWEDDDQYFKAIDVLAMIRAAGCVVEGQPAEPSTGWDSPGPTP